jgi:hypothetical protein
MISEEMILRYFTKLLHRFEGLFLHPPQFPMIVSTRANLVIIFGIESDLFNLLFGKIILSKDFTLMKPIIGNCL